MTLQTERRGLKQGRSKAGTPPEPTETQDPLLNGGRDGLEASRTASRVQLHLSLAMHSCNTSSWSAFTLLQERTSAEVLSHHIHRKQQWRNVLEITPPSQDFSICAIINKG